MWGLTMEEASGSPADVWPENMPAVRVFLAMSTQWIVGPGGPVGFAYGSLPFVLRRLKIATDQHDSVFFDLQVMEHEALAFFSERRKKDEQRHNPQAGRRYKRR